MTDSRRPIQQTEVQVVDRAGAPKLVREGEPQALVNETALAIWDLCDGNTTVDEMVVAVVELCGDSPEEVAADVVGVLDEFSRISVIGWS